MNAVTRQALAAMDVPTVEFELNGKSVTARADETLLSVAKRGGIGGAAPVLQRGSTSRW